jgi:hypothetical protein
MVRIDVDLEDFMVIINDLYFLGHRVAMSVCLCVCFLDTEIHWFWDLLKMSGAKKFLHWLLGEEVSISAQPGQSFCLLWQVVFICCQTGPAQTLAFEDLDNHNIIACA